MIEFRNVCKLYSGRDVLDDATFRVNKGEKIGFVGPNGSGKTTVFSMISGDLSPDKGEIVVPEKLRIGFLHQQLSFFKAEQPLIEFVEAASGELPRIQERIHELEAALKDASGSQQEALLNELGTLQNRFEMLGGYEMTHRAASALNGLGFSESDHQKAMGSFSGGWQMRAAMAQVLLGEPDVLMLDEPSNYLDIPAVEWLQRRLRSYQGTLMLISHDRFLLNSLTDITIEINGGKIIRYPGNYTYYIHEREERRRHAELAQKNNDRKRQQLESNINRFRAKASKASQVQSWMKMLDKIEDIDAPDDLHFSGTIRIPPPPPCGTEVIRLENVSHSYDGKRWILKDINLTIQHGQKIGIFGYNGMGKSTLLKIIAGRFAPTEGIRTLGHKVIVGYQAQEFAELLPAEQTAFDVVRAAAAGTENGSQRVREILGAFGFSGDSALKPCGVLSGGEKIRLCFARIFVNPPNLLILDEPTTHLDIAAREALQQAVRTYPGTVCLVSHDVEFLRGTADEILEMRSPGVRLHLGNYDYFKERVAQEQAALAAKETASSSRNKSPSMPEPQSANNGVSQKDQRREKAVKRQQMAPQKRRLEKEVSKLEKEIEALEAEKAKLVETLSNPAEKIDFASVQKKLKDLDYDISKTTILWEESASQLEAFMKEYSAIGE